MTTLPTVAEECAIRDATLLDAEAIRRIYAPVVEGSATSFEVEVPSAEEMRRRIESTIPSLPWLVAGSGSEVLGFAYAGPHRSRAAYRWSVETSVYVDARHRRAGVGRALYSTLLERTAELGYVRAFAGITLPNPGSVALHEALGFTPIGVFRSVGFKLGKWHDVSWWEHQLVDAPPQPSEPVRPPSKRADDARDRQSAIDGDAPSPGASS
jgi:phosphinothricin acetyltransferase